MRLKSCVFVLLLAVLAGHAQDQQFAVTSLEIDRSQITGNSNDFATVTVKLNMPVPLYFYDGLFVQANNDPLVLDHFFPTFTTIPAGESQGTFVIAGACVSEPTPVTVWAELFGQRQASGEVLVTPPRISISIDPETITDRGTQKAIATIRIDPAPRVPAAVHLTADPASAVFFSPGLDIVVPMSGVTQVVVRGRILTERKAVKITASGCGAPGTAQLTVVPVSAPPTRKIRATLLFDNKQETQSISQNTQLTARVPLGGQIKMEMLDNSETPLAATFLLASSQPAEPIASNALWPENILLTFRSMLSTEAVFQAVHKGTVALTIVPSGAQGLSTVVKVQVVDPFSIGTSHSEVDQYVTPLAHRTGILPQYVKAQTEQESAFNPTSYRYEPLAPWVGDIGIISRYGTAASKQGDLRTVAPYSSYRLATEPDNLDGALAAGDKLSDDDSGTRHGFKTCDLSPAETCVAGTSRPITPKDEFVSVKHIVVANDAVFHWTSCSGCANHFHALDHDDFTGQTALAASYGYLQVTYVTAISRMHWKGVTTGERDPTLLWDTDQNIANGGGSLKLGTTFLTRLYRSEWPGTADSGDFIDSKDMDFSFIRPWNAYHGVQCSGPVGCYGLEVLGRVPNYRPTLNDAIFTASPN